MPTSTTTRRDHTDLFLWQLTGKQVGFCLIELQVVDEGAKGEACLSVKDLTWFSKVALDLLVQLVSDCTPCL